jgi:predicted unusual protein kinase regulating ubiquinone biosynthesis (AarF/ABC1/UbiB family)
MAERFELIQVPQPVPDYSTRCVLTMDYVRGRKITALGLRSIQRVWWPGRRANE